MNKLVTARNDRGFFLQAKSGDPDYAGTDHSGVWVYDPSNSVVAGTRVTLTTATVTDFFGQIELTAPQVVVASSTSEALQIGRAHV